MNKIILSFIGVVIFVGAIGVLSAEEAPLLQTNDQFVPISSSSQSEFDLATNGFDIFTYQESAALTGTDIIRFELDNDGNYVLDPIPAATISGITQFKSIAATENHVYALSNNKIYIDSGSSVLEPDGGISDISARTYSSGNDFIYTVDNLSTGHLDILDSSGIVKHINVYQNNSTRIPVSVAVSDSGLIYVGYTGLFVEVYQHEYDGLTHSVTLVDSITELTFEPRIIAEANGSIYFADGAGSFVKYSHDGSVWSPAYEVFTGQIISALTVTTNNDVIVLHIEAESGEGIISRYSPANLPAPSNPFTLNVLPPLQSDVNNLVNHKRTIPIQFELIDDNGNLVLDQTAVLTTNQFTCETTDGVTVSDTTETSSDDLVFSLIDGKYKLNFSTKSLNPDSCYSLNAEINGIEEHIADILVR